MQFVILLEATLALAVFGLLLIVPQRFFALLRWCSSWLTRVAVLPYLPVWLISTTAIIGSAGIALICGIPEPSGHDEFSYLLAADTFSRGRLTNPTHPLWIYFESFHIIHQPTYASKFFPAQGLMLAAGQLIGGHPIVGVWASVGLACAGICWMLQAWLPKRWALAGALLGLVQVRFPPAGFFGYWSQSYRGGAIATLGGALVFGALPRIVRKPRTLDAVLFALGLAILANSRPFEGLITSFPAMLALSVWLLHKNDCPRRLLLGRVVLPIVVLLVATAAAMGFYNFRVTGDALRFPYVVHKDTYMVAPLLVFQKMGPPKTYNHELMHDFHTDWELTPYLRQQSLLGLLEETGKKLTILWAFYLGPTLTIPFVVMLPFVWRNKRMRFALGTCGLLIMALLMVNWVSPHYAAPITGLVLLLVTQAIRHLRLWSWKGRPIGRRLVYAIPCALFLSSSLFLMMRIKYSGYDWSRQRMQIIAELNRQGGHHLVIVRYVRDVPGYLSSHAEWVYNEADIDKAKVVWAREVDVNHNRKLLEYFKERQIWLLTFNENKPPAELVRYQRSWAYRQSITNYPR
jgi:hypothetical protein